MKIVVDESVCEGLGMCEAMSHEYFELEGETVTILNENPPEDQRADVQAAVNACPVMALTLEG